MSNLPEWYQDYFPGVGRAPKDAASCIDHPNQPSRKRRKPRVLGDAAAEAWGSGEFYEVQELPNYLPEDDRGILAGMDVFRGFLTDRKNGKGLSKDAAEQYCIDLLPELRDLHRHRNHWRRIVALCWEYADPHCGDCGGRGWVVAETQDQVERDAVMGRLLATYGETRMPVGACVCAESAGLPKPSYAGFTPGEVVRLS